MGSVTSRTVLSAACAFALLGLQACATPSAPSKEDMLAAAGFQIKLADNPDKLASLKQLPQDKFLHKQVKDQFITLYADASGCKCLYVGDRNAWQAYQQAAFANHIAEVNRDAAAEANEAAMVNEDAAAMNNFGWGPWGVETWGWGPW